MTTVRLAAPAKINLHLEVLGRRDDGFHAIETVFQTIDLHDEVVVRLVAQAGITLTVAGADLPADATNLAWRAADAWLGRRPGTGIAIELIKRIPAGAGLGGGSSDAAAVLRALQSLAEHPLPPAELAELAAGLGSDVPFFLIGGTAHAVGRGEQLTPLPDLPAVALTILRPAAECPTPAVYRGLNEDERGPRDARGAAWWACRLVEDLPSCLHNRLTGPASRLSAPVADLLAWLVRSGVPHLMSGSGSTCFALAHLDPPPGVRAWRTGFRPRARLDALTADGAYRPPPPVPRPPS
ncbi:MAG: 4-(cytidine 5'-diphospho)-2-C-methyl-D-erythritol kinase [Planctomycetes bacterium]|nr:4-(cytidine 5'-diphospho)-2-C-methyl-D-erythritol kinase [Planctomycetota bacterium]